MILSFTACSKSKDDPPADEPHQLPISEPSYIPHQHEIRIPFNTIEEWWKWEYEHDTYSSQERRFILPVLPEDYGSYKMVRDQEGIIYFNYEDKSSSVIKEFREQYGDDGYMFILIAQSESSKYNWDFDEYIRGQRETHSNDTFSSTEKNGIRFEYRFRSGFNIYDKPFARSWLYTLYEDNYFVTMRLPFGDEESVLAFIDELSFETYTVRDAMQIAEVAAEAEKARKRD